LSIKLRVCRQHQNKRHAPEGWNYGHQKLNIGQTFWAAERENLLEETEDSSFDSFLKISDLSGLFYVYGIQRI
jgi:hypothetical protein